MLAYCEGKGVRVLYVRHARHPFPAQWCSIKTAHAGGDTMEKYQAIRRKTMFKKGLSIIVFLCLLAAGNRAYGVFHDIGYVGPETANEDIWGRCTGICPIIPFDSNWHNPVNWGYLCNCPLPQYPPLACECIPVRPPDGNTWAAIEAHFPEPNIYEGNAACSRLSIYPWAGYSEVVGEQPFALTIGPNAGDVNCGVQIGICDRTQWNSEAYGYGVLNVFGGYLYTPGYSTKTTPVWYCPPSGLYIGGGALSTDLPDGQLGNGNGLNYGTVNMYGGSIVVPGIRINYGDVNLFGGLLYETNESPDNLIISQAHARNKINIEGNGVSGGELRLKGNRVAQVDDFYKTGRICACWGHGRLFVDINATDTSVTALCTPGSAWNPTPTDGKEQVVLSSILTWSPGKWAQASNGHAVYFGTDFNDVNEDNDSNVKGTYKGRQDANSYNSGGLPAGVTCYWRIDEYNDTNSDSPWKGQVWQFKTRGGEAIDPVPADGAVGLPIPLQLSWTPGIWAAQHDVYFGLNEANVASDTNANLKGTYKGRQDANVFTLDKLDYNLAPDTNYYWRIDEVNSANPNSPWIGDVWGFTNTNYFVVDNFESYSSTADMNQRWNTQYSGAGGMLALNEGTMQYDYNNSGSTYFSWSEARFDCNDGTGGADWTGGGALPDNDKARALAISYTGGPDNDADPNYDRMYVAIEDTAGHFGSIIKNNDPEAQRTSFWKQWNVNLADLNGPCNVSLKAVKYLYLGFGVRGNMVTPGGKGTVTFDNIRLYQKRCVPEYGPIADFTGDCRVDINDLNVFADHWLDSNVFFGLKHTALGQARLSTVPQGLAVSNIDATGDDGVLIALPEHIASLHVNYIDVGDPNQFPVGAYIQATSRGTVNGEPNQIVSMVHSVYTGSDVNTTVDFPALGPNSLTVNYYLNGHLVLKEENVDPASATWRCKIVKNGIKITFHKGFPWIDLGWVYCIKPSPWVWTPKDNYVQVDEIHMDADNGGIVSFDGYSNVTLTANGIPSITIIGEEVTFPDDTKFTPIDIKKDPAARIDFGDFAIMAQQWTMQQLWP